MKAIKITATIVGIILIFGGLTWLIDAEDRQRRAEVPFDIHVQSRGGQTQLAFSSPRTKELERKLEIPAGFSITESWYCKHHDVVFGTVDSGESTLYGGGTAGIIAASWIEIDGLWAYHPLDRGIPIGDGSNPDQSYSVLRVIRTDVLRRKHSNSCKNGKVTHYSFECDISTL